MFERFTDRARRVLVLAQDEAKLLNHNFIGTEHLLLGLLHEGEGVAAQALRSLDIHLPHARALVAETIGPVDRGALVASPPFTPRSKKVLELSLREALFLEHSYIGTEHLLLGLAREGEGVGAQVMVELGAPLDRVRAEVLARLGQDPSPRPGSPPGDAPRCPHCAAGLAGNAAYRRIEVPDDQGGDAVVVVVVYCRACGVAISIS